MKVVAAYLLAVLGGNTCPSAEHVSNILSSGTANDCCISLCTCVYKFDKFKLLDFFLLLSRWLQTLPRFQLLINDTLTGIPFFF